MTPSSMLAVVSCSGGKDSTATALCAIDAFGLDRVRLVIADTGHEHEETWRYVRETLPAALGLPVHEVRADFTQRIANKRVYIAEKWAGKGVPQASIDRALAALQPTGVPFLDLCLWKGRFPSRMVQFCTAELKRFPLEAYMVEQIRAGYGVESWRGVRRDESASRKDTPARETAPEGWEVVHPIVDWTAQQVVDFCVGRGVPLNPLYAQGMGRVGCMPCINVGKRELAEIARRWPEHIDRLREWEAAVSAAGKRGDTTFFTDVVAYEGEPVADVIARCRIDERVKWAKTSRGGTQYRLLPMAEEAGACSSIYGLCE
jgi:3'-phosphoadenosine 5'-phosphosulfate sulfotransferase (PAPS reductase)/FAD synthetase